MSKGIDIDVISSQAGHNNILSQISTDFLTSKNIEIH